MLRRLLIGALALMLAACTNQAPTATATSAAPGATSEPPVPATLVIVTRVPAQDIQSSIQMPPPGTLIASEGEDPNINVPFTRIKVVRLRLGITDQLIISSDGTFTYNDVQGVLSPQQMFNLNEAIKGIKFFGLQSTMVSLVPQPEGIYEYAVTIERGDEARTIISQDNFTPNEYVRFLSTLWNTTASLTVIPTSLPPATQMEP